MSAPVNKRGKGADIVRAPDADDAMTTGSSSDEENDELLSSQAEIQVEFEARTPSGGDFHGIKRLLQQVFLKAHVDLSALANIIITQGRDVGSVIKQGEVPEEEGLGDDDDFVFGITSVVNLSDRVKESTCIQQLHSLLLERGRTTADDRTLQLLRELLARDSSVTDRHVGLLVNERFVNIPPQIAGPLYENLLKEMLAANQKGQMFTFDYYILISKLYKAQTTRKAKGKRGGASTVVFSNPEDELFFERESIAWFECNVADESDSGLDGDWDADDDVGMVPFRRISIVPATEFSAIVSQIRNTFVAPI